MGLTVITAPINVDAASIVAGKLCEWETGGVGCGHGRHIVHYTSTSYITVYNSRVGQPTTGHRLIRPIATVIVQVAHPGDGDAAPALARELVGRAGTC